MGKWALVTGAANGIGFELARLLSSDDFNLVLVDLNVENLQEKREILEKEFKNEIHTKALNLGRQDAALEVYDFVESKGVALDVLVNNAGFGVFGAFSESDWEREQEMIFLHVNTPTQLVKLFLPGMIERKSGRILNVSSMAAFHPGPLMSIYYSTKSYLLSFSTSVATELKGTGVGMTVLCPGITKTGFQKSVGAGKPKINWNMACAQSVAAYGYKAMMKGEILAVPGLFNNALLVLRRFLPYPVLGKCVRYIQERNRQKHTV
ncbi:SDR family NAD(P)-dependent oxidoreductase [Mangrovibacterium sp.]|uniref:SDR family NAD(P)-dependent oxidoreductase n=1 Tax=Mangrovibacterium sp. TaxID=1961364 RepID=UPI0035667351